jgi:UDP-glucose 4-epimerase
VPDLNEVDMRANGARARHGQTVLITGGAGFIGSHVAERLLAHPEPDRVIVVDNLSTGRLANLSSILEDDRFEFVDGSIFDERLMDGLVSRSDRVVHLAAAVGVKLIMERPLHSFTTNIRGTEILLDAAQRHERPVLLASTSEIYGKNYDVPLHEDADRVLGSLAITRWSYATSKAVDEIMANCYFRERGLPTSIVRLFNTVGPRQSPTYGMVVPRFVRQALAGEDLTIHGDGQQTRCFVHVHDVAAALDELAHRDDLRGETFNVGSEEEITVQELARLIIERAGSRSRIRFVPYEAVYGEGFEDMRRRVPDTRKVREAIGWEPRRSLTDIIDDAIADARAELASPYRSA